MNSFSHLQFHAGVSQKFSNILVHASFWCVYMIKVVAGCIAVVGALTCASLLPSMCDLKATQMNVHHSLI